MSKKKESTSALARYWKIYGGAGAIFKSCYFWSALLMTVILYPSWSHKGWWDDILSLMPNLLGFSLGGFAMWIAIGDEAFKKIITGDEINEKGEVESSPYMSVNATFVHFILLQLLTIITALITKAYSSILIDNAFMYYYIGISYKYILLGFSFFAYFIFIYSVFSALAAVLAIFRVSSWYDKFMTLRNIQEESKKKNGDTITEKSS
ncbi:TPA: hypothetical protein F6W26_24720 [Citrobacter amalonaticus]|uniref:hypothetical protein n=1 Tax=Citrobacter TaxID=544 RepID=UPI0010CA016F|nr:MULTISPECIES: hypothetical protein [Citrobacter]MCM7547643.1 hypothetical protein [Enterobacter hormaechei]HAU4370685.1 hypothetical protein [Citrobacter amalonaticus]MDL4455952.1 hypothetical protein [Citrobacter youngae]MDM2937930.1 hypothetical protein [Citrobacter sp. Cy082]QMI04220.1 hypothetical protein HVY19_04885 [Citrobacter sp. RHB25-C09]